jgi:hypothetical protein
MKLFFTLFTSLLLTLTVFAQQITFCDDFEGYQNGDPIAQTSPSWNTWGELMTGTPIPFADDVNISTTMAYSGDFSLYLKDDVIDTQDVILVFDTTQNITNITTGSLSTPYTTGTFNFSQMMYIVQGKKGYINFQAENIPGVSWALEVNFETNGTILMTNTLGTTFSCNYPQGSWFEISFLIDLSNNIWDVYIDGISQGVFSNLINKIASLNLYPGIDSEYYIDDVCYYYDSTVIVLPPLNLAATNINNITGLDGQLKFPKVSVMNLGLTSINSFDIDFNYNGQIITENINGLNILTGGTYQVDFINNITLIAGSNPCISNIYNVNNVLYDDDNTDDTITTQIISITPAQGKLVIGEEATGTWCGWCPRGAVALNWMDKDYEGFWQGIAVHNNDPMEDSDYDDGLYTFHSGSYPSGVVDRTNNIDPGNFKEDFLQRIIIEPNGVITNGAELDSNILKVSLTVNIQNSINGNYKLACVLVEDSVTGNSSQYNQANSYSGGGSLVDVDGVDWNTLPTSVSYSQMIYRHVGRSVSPSFTGEPLSSTSFMVGDTETICFEFILDPSWDQSQINIVGMLIDNDDRIDNGSSTTILSAISTGYVACSTTSIAIELNGPNRINIYPNPAMDKIYISNLKEDNTLVKIHDIKGRLVLENKVSNKEYLNISKLSKGIYQIKFEGSDWNETRKLIKE